MRKPYIIGVTGGSASGKTLFLNKLLQTFEPEEVCLISQDNYYKPIDQQPLDDEGIENYDTPHSFDFDAYASDIRKIQNGETVFRQEYTFNNPAASPKMLEFKPAPVVVVEGIFVLYSPQLATLLDLKVFIDAKDYIKLKRRIVRDKIERGYDLDDVLYRYEKHVMPTYEKYIEPFKHDADLIIPNNNSFENGLDMVRIFLKEKINEQPCL
ncbi:uridine kinase [Echinicola pacifica]|uniref:uridine/cytidine kinase n=1 Tax=Echinicola pacifica TaxID=346377 RepID=A0A918ULJ1_9BACT|nr:uridine kinase [Echinicola pacifica]GGZ19385.1 uridine kinase [Echinicola pacifica]